jgi:DNA uptake protein ComE-like DNA-binding protein
MDFIRRQKIPVILLLAVLAGCTQQPTPQQLKEKTAEATATAKSDAKAVAEGIREGWNRNRPLDLNSSTRQDLLGLPGISGAQADRVIAGRPFREPGELVTRHIMSKAEYDKISDRVTAKK